MTKDVLKGGVWKCKQELIDQIILYIDTYNKRRAKPFCWIMTAILYQNKYIYLVFTTLGKAIGHIRNLLEKDGKHLTGAGRFFF